MIELPVCLEIGLSMHHLQISLSVNIENPWLYITLSLRTSTILTYLMDPNVGYFRGHCQCAASCDISVTITTERLSAAASARPHCQMKCHTLDVTHPSLLFSLDDDDPNDSDGDHFPPFCS